METLDPGTGSMISIARAFAIEHIDPNAAAWEQARQWPAETITLAVQAGLGGLLVPTSLGGAGLSVAGFTAVMEALAYADMGFAFALVVHNNLAAAVAEEATGQHRSRYLDAMLAGSTLGAFLLTEPDAGTHASAISTTAINQGGHWLLNGEKAWVTNAAGADLLRVYAQTEPGSGSTGIAAFLVQADQRGVIRGDPYEMLGAHATGSGGFRFENVELAPDQLFSPPGTAYPAAMEAIGLARVVVAGLCVGILRRGLDVAVEYLDQRTAFGSRLSENQGLRWMLADVATDIEAAAALTRLAAQAVDADASDASETMVQVAHAKKFAARAAVHGLEQCMQVLGANGFRQDRPVARHYAAARMAHYIDGTTEVQNLVIAKRLFEAR